MKTLNNIVTLLIILYIVQCVKDPVAINHDSMVVVLDKSNFDDTISVEGRIAMVEFYSPSCGTCIAMTDIVDSLAKTFHGTALIAKIDAHVNDSLAEAFRVERWPTFIFFKSGLEYNRQIGINSFDDLAALIQSSIDG